MKRIVFLVLASGITLGIIFLFVGALTGRESNKKIFFPSKYEWVFAPIENNDLGLAQTTAQNEIIEVMREKCEWKKPLSYYEDKVQIRFRIRRDAIGAQTFVDPSLCPEKN